MLRPSNMCSAETVCGLHCELFICRESCRVGRCWKHLVCPPGFSESSWMSLSTSLLLKRSSQKTHQTAENYSGTDNELKKILEVREKDLCLMCLCFTQRGKDWMMGSVFVDLWELEWRNASSAFPKTDVGTGVLSWRPARLWFTDDKYLIL